MKMTPVQSSKKVNGNIVLSNLQDRRENHEPRFKQGQLVRTAIIEKVFSKGDSTNWSYLIYSITEVIHDTIPSYRIN